MHSRTRHASTHGTAHAPAPVRAPGLRSALVLVAALLPAACAPATASGSADLPGDLADTGLYADLATKAIAADVLAYEPQYPLWTDGAAKRRWIRLPPGTWIDASDPDHLVFPRGTRLWKEFAFERRIETRYLELGVDGAWRFATFLWNADETRATLAPACGVPAACESAPGIPYDVPGRNDCSACHAAGPDVVLGFTALQLSSERDPLAPHAQVPLPDAVDLAELVRRGLVRGLPQHLVETPPRIAAASLRERAALGYLAANCGACHASSGALAGLGLDLSYSLAADGPAPALATALGQPSRFRWPGDSDPLRIAHGNPERSVLARRMASRQPLAQMPPLGTRLCDDAGLELVTAWIRDELAQRATTDDPTPQPARDRKDLP